MITALIWHHGPIWIDATANQEETIDRVRLEADRLLARDTCPPGHCSLHWEVRNDGFLVAHGYLHNLRRSWIVARLERRRR